MLSESLILVFFLILVAAANRALYYYNESDNKRSKISSLTSFSYVQVYLRISTLFIAIACIYLDHTYLYEIIGNEYIYLGASLCSLSIVMLFIARYNLKDNYSPCYDMKAPRDFVRHGVYKIVRHPIYLSNLILLAGVFLISGSAWICFNFSILFIYYLISAVKEERYLAKKFPSYKKYKDSTSMFIPGYKLIKK